MNTIKGDSYKNIILYWLPEVVSVSILLAVPSIIDSLIIASLGSVTTFGALGMATNVLITLTKLAEAVPVASIAFIGRFNGSGDFKKCGEYFYNTFWITFILGISQFILILFGAKSIFKCLGVSDKMTNIGIPFLQLKSLGIILILSAMVFVGFMRAVKNTHIPMMLNIIGIVIFIFFDYALVLGKFGFAARGLIGSAIASIIQYTAMNAIALAYVLFNNNYRIYFPNFLKSCFDIKKITQIVSMSWPIIIDKTTISLSHLWLVTLITPMGKYAIVSYNVIRNLDMFAFIPVMASAQIITFLVSNKLGAKDIDGAIANIKKLLIITALTFIPVLIILSVGSHYFINLFDPKNKFTDFAVIALPFINLMAIFDGLQVVLAGALRGAGDVKVVMWGRFCVCAFFFGPVSWSISHLQIQSIIVKFTLVYSSFFVATAAISLIYIRRLRGNFWRILDKN
ncbi:MAG: MATE family efflux transporter [bacterium]